MCYIGNPTHKFKLSYLHIHLFKMKIVFVLFMMMAMIVSIKGETREECYNRCDQTCKGSIVCMGGCVDNEQCNSKPPASAAKSRPSFSTVVADELHGADPQQ